ncbi:MAG TPA: hypothetical protein VE863_03895 [Pyrinomonadaceae bacterium]|jgi:hypothetical protein|nr:hypothetical protein [Pyrinomonadaceae bacterium]
MSNNRSTTPDVNVTFYDNFVPSLKAAQYTVKVSQAVTVDTTQTAQDGGNADIPAHPQPDITQTFMVRGPRFVIDPADVHRAYPPPNGVGKYDEHLPMIVLNKRALPWERQMDLNVGDAQTYPWMALLLFSDDELLTPKTADANATAPASGSQQNPTRAASFALNDVVIAASQSNFTTSGPPAGILGPTLGLEDDEDPQKIYCNVIEISADTFAQLIPAGNDLRFLAHVRQVSTENKEPLNMTHDGWFSVVLGNRFCVPPTDSTSTAGQRNIAHLVSLEGFESYLGTNAPLQPNGFQKVRLISLYSWVFNCLPDAKENFRELMLNLISGQSEQGTDLLLRLPLTSTTAESTAETTALTRLQNGYIPLSYATQTGEQTFAWYRGPLAPVVTSSFLQTSSLDAPDNPEAPENVSEAMIFDPASGLFDQSYAVGFQTGRSLGLASLPFATNLLQWRRDAHGLIDLLMEYMRSPHLSGILQKEGIIDAQGNLTGVGVTDLAELLDANLVSNAFKDFLATEFSDNIAKLIGQTGGFTQTDQNRSSSNPSTNQPVVPADLSNLMQDPAVVTLIQQLSGLEDAVHGAEQFDAGIMPHQIIEWLAKKALLYDVPFNNLVPNARMLPVESVRFFYLDENWIDSLIDGALSVGVQSSRDRLFHQLMRDALHRAVDEVLQEVRDRMRGVNSTSAPAMGTMAGFVLRSAVVSGWLGLEVRAWSEADDTNPMKPLRLDRISPTVMIGIYPDVPVKLEFNEPTEGLVFGFEDEGMAVRYLPGIAGATLSNTGQIINSEDPTYLTPSEINQLKRAQPANQPPLNIAALATALQNKFVAPQPVLTPASFAVQVVRVPEQMLFVPENGANQ